MKSLSVSDDLHRKFKDYTEDRGLKIKRAVEMALERWMKEECNKGVEEFKESK